MLGNLPWLLLTTDHLVYSEMPQPFAPIWRLWICLRCSNVICLNSVEIVNAAIYGMVRMLLRCAPWESFYTSSLESIA